jgi:hypothetical protein
MIYRAVRAVHRGYALTLFWLYFCLFGLAFFLIFILPPATIALLFLGIFGLVAAWSGNILLCAVGNALARRSLRRARCPHCGAGMERAAHREDSDGHGSSGAAADQELVACIQCGRRFERCGAAIEESDGHVALAGP